MSNPLSSPHPTHQQLDELEALMQRMLALPVGPSDDEPPAETTEPVPHAEESESAPPPPPIELSVLAPSAPVAESEPVNVAIQERPPEPMPPPAMMEEVRPLRPLVRKRQVAWGLRPLLWINRTFDQATVRLGRPGHWLRGARGRTILGGTGLVLLGSAVIWGVSGWMGWPW